MYLPLHTVSWLGQCWQKERGLFLLVFILPMTNAITTDISIPLACTDVHSCARFGVCPKVRGAENEHFELPLTCMGRCLQPRDVSRRQRAQAVQPGALGVRVSQEHKALS